MSDTKHTEGPWSLNKQYADIEVRGPADSGVLIAVMSPWGIAADTPSPQEANARLIAAAPELLEALQLVVDKLGSDFELYREQQFAIDTARAAIAKATGSTHV